MLQQRHQHDPSNVMIKKWTVVVMLVKSWRLVAERGSERVHQYYNKERAYCILSQLFVPVWRLHRRMRRVKAARRIGEFALRAIRRMREDRRTSAANLIYCYMKNRFAWFRWYVNSLRRKVIRIQRAYRRWCLRRQSFTVVNLWRIRAVEPEYWCVARKIREQIGMGGLEIYEHLPDRMLKKLIGAKMASHRWCWIQQVMQRKAQAVEIFRKTRRGSDVSEMAQRMPGLSRRQIQVLLPVYRPLLTDAELYSIIDEACWTLSELRGTPELRAHLKCGVPTRPSVVQGGLAQFSFPTEVDVVYSTVPIA
jgi:hypothetical protein